MTTEHLYNPKDVRRIRELLYKEQQGSCALTLHNITEKEAVLDHDHSSQLVRAVLHRQANAALGKIENIWTRYLKHWYKGDLASFLRQAASYIETVNENTESRWYHPKWIKKVNTEFNKLSASSQKNILNIIGCDDFGTNATQRKKLFNNKVINGDVTYELLMYHLTRENSLNQKENNNNEV